MNRLGLKLICLLISIVLWIQVASTTVLDETVDLPLQVRGLKAGATVAGNELPASVPVRLRGSKLRLISHRYFGTEIGSVVLDLTHETTGEPIQHEFGVADVRSDLTVLGIIPPQEVKLVIDRVATARLPVHVVTEGDPPEGRALLCAPRADPTTAVVSGPSRLLAGLDRVRTEPVDLGRVRNTAELACTLHVPQVGLSVAPTSVRVNVEMVPRESRTFADVPVAVTGAAPRLAASVFPPAATVTVSGPADSLRILAAARVGVTVSVAGLRNGTHHLRAQAQLPETYRLQSVVPDQFVVRLGRADHGGE